MHKITRKRIGIVTSTYPRWKNDSSPAFVHELAKQMHRMGHDVYVLAPHCPGSRSHEVLDGVRIHRFRYTFPPMRPRLAYGGGVATNMRRSPLAVAQIPLFVLAQLWATACMIRRHRLDAVNAHWLVFQGLTAALICGIMRVRLVVTAHAADVFALRRARLGHLLTRMIFAGARRVICVSSTYPAILSELGAQSGRMVVLPMGVDTSRFHPLPQAERAEVRRRLFPESGERLILLAVGRMEEKKGFVYLVRAMQQVAQRAKNVELWFVGGGSEEEHLRACVHDCGLHEHVHFLGPQGSDSIHEYYQASDGLVVPSIIQPNGETEGMPVVILEALASGCPVIASRVSGIPDVVNEGVNGLLVEPGDVAELASTIMRFARDDALRARLSARAAESVERYSWPNVTRSYLHWIGEPSTSTCTSRVPRSVGAIPGKRGRSEMRRERAATQPTIGVWHPVDTTNQGDRAINRAVVDNLCTAFPNSRIILFAKDLAVARRLFPHERISFIRYGGPSFADRQSLGQLDILLCGGGSLMQQSSWLYVPQQLRPAFLAKKCGVPTVLYCSGVEPISSSWLRGLVRKSCHDVFDALIVRGPRSKENLRHCGVTKEIVVSVDPAVSLRPAPSEEVRAYLLDKLGLDPARIFISLCPKVIRAYGGILPVSLRKKINFKRWIVQRRVDRAFAKLVDYLVERHTAQVVLIPMYHAQGDLAVCRNIHRLCTRKDHVRVLDELLDSSALLKGVFGAMTMHLGVRLHSVILATSAAVPSGLVAYMHKGHEYMELAGMREYTLEERELSFDALQKLADRVWDAAPALRFHLAARQAALANRYSETNEVVRAMLKREPLRLNRRAGNSDS